MAVIYWLAGGMAFAAFVSAKWGRSPGPAVAFSLLALVLFFITPAGQGALVFVTKLGGHAVESAGGSR